MKKLIVCLSLLTVLSPGYVQAEELTSGTGIVVSASETASTEPTEEKKKAGELVKEAAEIVAASVRQTLREAQVAQKLTSVNGLAAVAINGQVSGVTYSDAVREQDYGTYEIDLDVNVVSDEAFLTVNNFLAEFFRVNIQKASTENFKLTGIIGGYEYQRYERGSEFYGVHSLIISGIAVDVSLDLGKEGNLKLIISNQTDLSFDYSTRNNQAGQGIAFNMDQTIALEVAKWTFSYLIDFKATAYEDSQTGAAYFNNAFRVEYQINDNTSAFGEFGFGTAMRPELTLGVRVQLDGKRRRRNKRN
jgi:hypothetical protein